MIKAVHCKTEQRGDEDQIQYEDNSHQQAKQTFNRTQFQRVPIVFSHSPRHGPEYQRKQHQTQRTSQHRQDKLSVLQTARAFAYKKRVRQDHLHTPALVRLENEFVLTVALEKRHRTDSLPALRLTVYTSQLRNFDIAVSNRRHGELTEQGCRPQKRLLSTPAQDVRARDGLCVVFRSRGSCTGCCVGIVTIQKRMPQVQSSPTAATPGTVVGNKEAELLVQHQVQVAVEEDRVAGVSDDSMSVARFFIEPVTHRIRCVVEGEQPAVHQARGLRLEYLHITKLTVG